MSTTIRSLIEARLRGMEGGCFQDFCLDFLPLFESRYKGVQRFGHTAEGKTRAGTPDLLKTYPNGQQIAVQCGTEENYWKIPDDPTKWKPLLDARKCLEKLEGLIEVVLVANREIPTNQPNTRVYLISTLKSETTAQITAISCEEFGQFISSSLHEPSSRRLLEKYCPEAYAAFSHETQARQWQIGREVALERFVPAGELFRLIDEVVESRANIHNPSEYIIERLDILGGFKLSRIPEFDGIERPTVEALPLKDPLGKVWILIGMPKIGKTSLLLQLMQNWKSLNVHWYDCPVDNSDCARAIAYDLLQAYFPEHEYISSLLNSDLKLRTALKQALPIQDPILIIVDNANHFSPQSAHLLKQTITAVKSSGKFTNIAIIFSSNQQLSALASSIDHEVISPKWGPDELRQFLTSEAIKCDCSPQYMDLLRTLSGGHPLLAKSKATRYPTLPDLLKGVGQKESTQDDKQLLNEVQNLLYDEILRDGDSQNFVQRLSVLLFPADEETLDVLRLKVLPTITCSAGVLLANIGRSVIEGNNADGFTVPLVFREVAKTRLSSGEIQRIYSAIVDEYLNPYLRTINFNKAMRGIAYALVSESFDKVFGWTAILVSVALQKRLDSARLTEILRRLEFVPGIPSTGVLEIEKAVTVTVMADAYLRLKDFGSARTILRHIPTELVVLDDLEPIRAKAIPDINFFLVMLRSISEAGCDGDIYSELSKVNLTVLKHSQDSHELFFSLLSQSIRKATIFNLSPELIVTCFRIIEDRNYHDCALAYDIALNIGVRAKRDGVSLENIEHFFENNKFGQALKSAASATMLVEARDGKAALQQANLAIATAQELGFTNAKIWVYLHQTKGDAAYQIDDYAIAKASYRQVLANSNAEAFESAWASWRIGIITDDEVSLGSAARVFGMLGYHESCGRALGARACLLFSEGRQKDAIDCFASILERYYLDGREDYGPAAALCISQLYRFKGQKSEDALFQENENFPGMEPKFYANVLETARPQSGPIGAFYLLGEAYRLCEMNTTAKEFIRKALQFPLINENDHKVLSLVIRDAIQTYLTPDDPTEIKRCLTLLILEWNKRDLKWMNFARTCLFHAVENGSSAQRWTQVICQLLEEVLSQGGITDLFWMSELCLKRAEAAKYAGNTQKAISLFDRSLKESKASQNNDVCRRAAHALGFELGLQAPSILIVGEYHLESLRLLDAMTLSDKAIADLGINLFRFWSAITFRTLRSTDIRAKRYLMDGAKALKQQGVPEDVCAWTMVVILAALFDYSGPSVDYAIQQLSPIQNTLPIEILTNLDGLLN